MPFAQLLPSRKFSGKDRQRTQGNRSYLHLLNSLQGPQVLLLDITGAAKISVGSGVKPKQNRVQWWRKADTFSTGSQFSQRQVMATGDDNILTTELMAYWEQNQVLH